MYFISSLVKLLIIAAMVFAASRLSGPGVLFFVQGWSMTYLGVVAAGLRQAARGKRHGT